MGIRPFKDIPKDVREWGVYLRDAAISLDSATGIAAVTAGGTGASTVAGARTNLGLGTLAVLSEVNDAQWGTTPLGVGNGGTGAGDGPTAQVNLGLLSGTYTPTLTNVTNLTASTAYQCQYSQVGTVVTVSGKVDVDPTAAVATELGISLPIASNLATAQNCGGVAFAAAVAGQGAAILADAANDRASMQWVAADLANRSMHFTFQYVVI